MITKQLRYTNEVAWYIRCPGCAHNYATRRLTAMCINPTCRLLGVSVNWTEGRESRAPVILDPGVIAAYFSS